MSVSYTCPNPECGVTLKTPNRVQAGKSVKCPKCSKPFVPESGEQKEKEQEKAKEKPKEPAGGTLKLAEEPKKPEPAKSEPPKKPFADDDEESDESIRKGYGVQVETEEEKEQAEKNKPAFGDLKDANKKSARGPAMSLLVLPSNMLTLGGLLTCVGGLGAFLIGMWPLVFNDAPPGEEEMEEAIVTMILGVVIFFWGAMVCFGASQMQELNSYPWAMVGSIMGIAAFGVGIFGIMMLQNPKVRAGFEEGSMLDDDEEEEEEEDDDDDEDDDDEDEDEDDDDDDGGGSAKKGSTGKKLAKKVGKGLLKKALGGDDEDE
jgi:hypothetical protein